MKDLVIYKEIVKAIKVSKSNIDLESDMNEIDINNKDLMIKLFYDNEIQEKAKEKVKKYNG